MASTTVKVPTTVFSNLNPNTPRWESTKNQVFEALKEFGCLEAIYDKVPDEIRESMFDSLKEVCELPLSKLKEYRGKPYHTYEGKIPSIPIHNIVRSADLLLPNSVETFASTFWPDETFNYCNMAKSYYKPLMELDGMIKRMILESLGLNNYIDEFLDRTSYLLRFTNYKPIQDEDGKIPGLGAHTDGGYLTIIKQNQIGLQLNKNGEWIDFTTASPNSYVVLLGDTFEAWTNGRLSSAFHRVDMKGGSDRLSIQLFSSPTPTDTMEAPKELVDEEHPLLFKPFTMLEYYAYVMSGSKNGVGLKHYCGL